MLSKTIGIALFIILTLAGLLVGLYFRRKLLARLKNTILDNWLVQTLGILIVLPPLLIVFATSPFILSLSVNGAADWWKQILSHAPNIDLVSLISNLVVSIISVTFGLGVARTLNKATIRGLGENRIDINIRTLIGRIIYVITLVIVLFWILSLWRVPLTMPVTMLGAITVALTVSLQDILKDLVAGFYILLERPFYIGNIVSITNAGITYTGHVEDIQLRATRLRLLSGEEVMVPNTLLFHSVVTNASYYGERRATIAVTLKREDYQKEETHATIKRELKNIVTILSHVEPQVLFNSYVEEKVTLNVRFWISPEQPETVTDAMNALHEALPTAELTVTELAGNI
ncbi:mechanosensitive ion channel family protein [Thermosporothrix hazakensis]|nr:mechanosensitive ion channel domain-containing protein [Thermosporothrix hazakensis]BBH88813.1 hypothetical protein KTC_35640 [Thermosporothrix sp. COM3]GCE46997.1 hypothetical protein KTH_18660 [Thermosporothrix hazakensis]